MVASLMRVGVAGTDWMLSRALLAQYCSQLCAGDYRQNTLSGLFWAADALRTLLSRSFLVFAYCSYVRTVCRTAARLENYRPFSFYQADGARQFGCANLSSMRSLA